jgi:tRNA(Arg) A34 adenosine deaminase TadA
MCLSACIKAKITELYYGASQEEGNNPNIRADYIKEHTLTQLNLYSGFMKEEFEKQIQRGRDSLDNSKVEFKK